MRLDYEIAEQLATETGLPLSDIYEMDADEIDRLLWGEGVDDPALHVPDESEPFLAALADYYNMKPEEYMDEPAYDWPLEEFGR